MPSSPAPDLLESFADCRMVKVTIPLRQDKVLHLDGVVVNLTASSLKIQLPSQTLPVADLAEQGRWCITFDKGVSFLTVWAQLTELLAPDLIQLDVTGSQATQYSRRDHRVDTEVYLRYWQAGDGRQQLPPQRTRVNLSGYGISFHAATPLPANRLVELELFLPGATLEKVRCVARVIRGGDDQQQPSVTALELVNLSQTDIEKIINFCMTEQFREMQQKARMLAASISSQSS